VAKTDKSRLCQLGALVLLLGTLGTVLAEADPESVIKYRRASMKSLGGHMGAMAQIVRGRVDYRDQLVPHAEAVAAVSKTTLKLFPEGSDFGETRAKEAVWEKWAAFEKAAGKAEKAAADFLATAKGADQAAVGKAFKALSDACKGCHKSFREKEE